MKENSNVVIVICFVNTTVLVSKGYPIYIVSHRPS